MTQTVLISGATGFIASHTVASLLAAGYQVIGTVRRPDDAAGTQHLRALPGAAERLRIVGADLLTPGAFDAYAAEADFVVHMASPFHITVKDPERDLVRPAIEGTLSMLSACAKSASVKRVVVTSSMAAITDEPDSERVLTEADWNEKSSLTRNPYYFSKAQAERAAWDFVERNKPSWDLVVINPFIVIGPSMAKAVNESNKILVDLMNGAYPMIMALTWGFVDVRDVAQAHVRALTAQAKGRYICAGETRTMRALIDFLKQNGYAHGKMPGIGLDSPVLNRLALLAAYTQPKGVASYLRSHLGRIVRYDNRKARTDLALDFRPLNESLLETMADLARWGHIRAGAA